MSRRIPKRLEKRRREREALFDRLADGLYRAYGIERLKDAPREPCGMSGDEIAEAVAKLGMVIDDCLRAWPVLKITRERAVAMWPPCQREGHEGVIYEYVKP